MKNKLVHLGIITIFCSLYFLVATISMINSVEFFDLAHDGVMNWSLAIGFELGAAASLAAIIILDKTNRFMVWTLFLLLTAFQMMANSYHAFVNLEAYMGWIELFGLEEMEPLAQKRILSIVSGAVLPVVALGFIKSLVDYIRPENKNAYKEEESLDDLLGGTPKPIIAKEEIDSSRLQKMRENQVKKIVKEQQPFQEKIDEIKNQHKEKIKEKVKNLEPLPETLPQTPPKEDPLKETVKQSIEEPKPEIPTQTEPANQPIQGSEGKVNVRIDGDTTYVTTEQIPKPHLPSGSTINNE